jgi:putative membrane protein
MRLVMMVASAVCLALPAAAQIGNPAGMAPATPLAEPGKPAPHQMNTQDRLFTHLAANGGMAEVELAKLAAQRAQSEKVKQFARMMQDDHGKANNQLGDLAKKANVPLPNELSPDQKAMHDELARTQGAQFDTAYMQVQLVEHQKTVLLMEWEISFGQDADLQRFAAAMLPSVLRHLQVAQDIMSELTGAGPQGAHPAIATTTASNGDAPTRSPAKK